MSRYLAIFLTFARACLVRDMTFRANFILECLTSLGWMSMNLAFYLLVFTYTSEIGQGSGWSKAPFFAFVATGLIINSVVQAFFMPSAEELTELVRTGGLDAVLVQPLDAQFMLSLHRVDFSSAIWLGKVRGADLVTSLAIEAAWVVVMAVVCRLAWWRGTRRYSAFGG